MSWSVDNNVIDVVKVIENTIFIHNIEISYIEDYTVIDKWKDYKS